MQQSQHSPGDLAPIMAITEGYRSMLLLKAAHELKVFDELEKYGAETGISSKDLAQKCEWDASRCERLLNALTAIKMVEKLYPGDRQEAVYKCSETGRLLMTTGDFTGYINGTAKDDHAFGSLPAQIRTASMASVEYPLHMTFHKGDAAEMAKHQVGTAEDHSHQTGKEGGEHHGHHEHKGHGHDGDKGHGHHSHGTDPEKLAKMYKFFGGLGEMYKRQLVTTFDLSQYNTVCDLGGGSGVFSYELARVYPNMSITLFDVPPTIETVKRYFLPKDENLKVELMAGDFTEDNLPAADLYLMSLIIHDWSDAHVSALLKKVHTAINKNGALLVFEKCMDEDKCGPVMAAMWDLRVMSHCAGHLRSESEYRALFTAHGFGNIQIRKLSRKYSMYDVIYCKKM